MRKRVLRSYTISTISIALVLFVLGSIGYAISSIYRASREARESVVMFVELSDELSTIERDSLSSVIAANRLVGSVKFVSKDEKLADEQFRRSFDIDVKGLLDKNPLPDSFDVTLTSASADTEAVKDFAAQLREVKGINYVSYPEELLAEVHSTLNAMQLLLLLFGGAMLLISLVLLSNTIRLTIFSRREAINTMKLVGATKWFIVKPFLGRSLLQGFVAGIVATLLFGGALVGINHYLPQMGITAQVELIAVIAAAMVAAGVVVATLFTVFAVNKFVKMRSNKIYMY